MAMDDPAASPPGSRTEYAEDRTILASERTFASWLRTGYAGIGIGLAFNALFVRLEPPWVPRLMATAFLAIAITIFISADRRACAVLSRLKAHTVTTARSSHLRLITIISVIATVALIAAMWLLPFQVAESPR
jgi:putative membrane protein